MTTNSLSKISLLKLNLISFVFCFSFAFLNAQERLDSLIEVSKNQQGEQLVVTLNELSWEYKNSIQDSAFYYGRKALKISKKENIKKGIAASYNSIASAFQAGGMFDSAQVYQNRSFKIHKGLDDSLGMADNHNNLGIILDESGAYDSALKNYFDALKIYENTSNNEANVAMVLGNIGIVYKKQKEFDRTLSYYKRALKIYESTKNEVGQVITRGNIGSLLLQMEKYEEAISYAIEAANQYEKLGYVRYVPYMQNNIAVAKDSLKFHEEAKALYLKAIQQFKADKNFYELTNTYIGIGQNSLYKNQPQKAINYFEQALMLAKENSFKEFEVRVYDKLASAFARNKNYKQAYQFKQLFNAENDSLFRADKTKTIFELETKYQTQLKEKEILKQRAQLAEKEIEVNQKNNLLYGSLGIAIILGLLGYLFYNQQRLKNRQLKKEVELKQALANIETKNKLQEQRLRISRDLHDNIGSQLTFIISSLDNLKFGFPEMKEKLASKLGGISQFTSQTIYELRDTIWAMNKEEISFEDLQVRIANFVEKAKGVSTTSVGFIVDDNVSKKAMLSSVVGMNVYRIIQEGVNNAIKYADANSIDIKISEEKNFFKVVVKDDGRGFNINEVVMGNGLNNMRKRTRDIEGEIVFNSEILNGTEIVLKIL
ncbi:two-component sensor histidine kinase [Patiriisocius marinistellae]|uniref:histidine kinase n=1 Tax=Patiriisocius marinistellae TaxID=2494560 RepID=A0A5J4G3H3_9FLAO|nr:sensor histidine kinase [Patiriisocius marinistellae]GEQ86911.1 two-component sensor histidine kinase [Patiriisocius marinistellae]